MGRTKRLRDRRRNEIIPKNCSNVLGLFNYLRQFSWANESSLTCKYFPSTGRGLCSKNTIASGNVLIKLPLKAMVTLVTLEEDNDFRNVAKVLEGSESNLPFQSLLAFYIIYRNHIDDSNSRLRLYLDSIPKTFATPYFCQSDELYFLPEIILQQTVGQNQKIRESLKTLHNAFEGKNCSCCGQSFNKDIFTANELKWAYFAVNTRSVFVNALEIRSLIKGESYYKKLISDAPEMALAPFLDLFNHSDTASTEPEIVKENNELYLQLITKNSYEPLQQAFISYGTLTNLKLLTEYGFTLENNANDYFEVSLADIEELIKTDKAFKGKLFHSNKFKFIREHNLSDQMFINAFDGMSHNLQVTLYLIFVEDSYYPNVLNKTAFGTTIPYEDFVQEEVKLLILFKIKEYSTFMENLIKLKQLSESGDAVVTYLKHSISYLQSCLDCFK